MTALPFFGLDKEAHPLLKTYVATPLIKSTSFDESSGCYSYTA